MLEKRPKHMSLLLISFLLLLPATSAFLQVVAPSSQRLSVTRHAVQVSNETEVQLLDPKFVQRHKKWIVLIDDEESIRLAVGDYLYDQGYQVTACADADAFLELIQLQDERIPDAIVSDIRMPGLTGLELLGLLKKDVRLKRVPVILLTAKGMTQDRIAGYKAGAHVYLPKPFDAEELLSILDNAIVRRKQMATHNSGALMDLKHEMEQIKQVMKRNSQQVVQKTDVYLTLVERQVLELLAQGLTNPEIADQRNVNVLGIQKTISKLYKKSQTKTRTELLRWAMKTGYVSTRKQ